MSTHFLRKLFTERWKQQLHQALEPSISAAQKAAQSAEQAARSAEAAAQAAQVSAASLAEALKQITPDDRTRTAQRKTAQRRFVILFASCLFFLFGAIMVGRFVPTAFTDPTGAQGYFGPSGGGIAQVRIADPQTPKQGKTTSVYISADYSWYTTKVHYTLWVPEYLAGAQFVFLLSEGATMSGISSRDTSLRTRAGHCELDYPSAMLQHYSVSCQLVYGIVPRTSQTLSANQIHCGTQDAVSTKYASIQISGEDVTTGDIDWAHHMTRLPAVGYAHTDFRPTDVGERFALVKQNPCTTLFLNDNWKFEDAQPEPTGQGQLDLDWTGQPASIGVNILSKSTNAEGIANVLIVLSGALAAVVVALASPTYQALSEYREHTRSLKASGANR